jgi:hypothetical protein
MHELRWQKDHVMKISDITVTFTVTASAEEMLALLKLIEDFKKAHSVVGIAITEQPPVVR